MRISKHGDLLRRLFPRYCRLCGEIAPEDTALCGPCREALPWYTTPCRRCAKPMPPLEEATPLCGRCRSNPPVFSHVVAPLRYESPVNRLIAEFKFNAHLATGRLLAQLLLRAVIERDATPPDLVLPTPLHPISLRERGFNQAAELSGHIARELGLPWRSRPLRKIRKTVAQHELKKRQRLVNLRGAITCDADLSGLSIAVVDDIMTTAGTANEISRVLTRSGASDVRLWVVARTP